LVCLRCWEGEVNKALEVRKRLSRNAKNDFTLVGKCQSAVRRLLTKSVYGS
jgi:hypothetical protein